MNGVAVKDPLVPAVVHVICWNGTPGAAAEVHRLEGEDLHILCDTRKAFNPGAVLVTTKSGDMTQVTLAVAIKKGLLAPFLPGGALCRHIVMTVIDAMGKRAVHAPIHTPFNKTPQQIQAQRLKGGLLAGYLETLGIQLP